MLEQLNKETNQMLARRSSSSPHRTRYSVRVFNPIELTGSSIWIIFNGARRDGAAEIDDSSISLHTENGYHMSDLENTLTQDDKATLILAALELVDDWHSIDIATANMSHIH